MNLTDLSTVRQAVPRLATTSDSEINRLIAEASGVITGYCSNNFSSASYTETYDSDPSGPLFLRQRPVTAITAVATGTGFATAVDLSTVRFDPLTGEVRWGGTMGYFPTDPFDLWAPFWGCGWQSVRITYTAGGAIPPAVSGRCLAILNRIAAGLAQNMTLRSKSMGNLSYTLVDATQFMSLTEDDRRILSPYRIYSI